MSDNETPPIVAPATPTNDMLAAGFRSVVFAIGASSAIMGFLRTDDLVGLVNYLKSSDFAAGALAALGVASFLWGQWKTRHRSNQLTAVAASPAVPNRVVRLPSDPDPTKPTDAAALAASFKREN